MSDAYLRGFALGLSLIVAIGAQNAFVLEKGLARTHVLPLVLICAVSDALLIAAGVGGLGRMISAHPGLIRWVTIAGAFFLFAYAIMAARRAFAPSAMATRESRQTPLTATVATALALTFLNPHVYLDTVVLLGSLSARYTDQAERGAYAVGAATASFMWFFGLGYGARWLAPLFASPLAWRILDALIAVTMTVLAASLLLSLD
ncbi:LysE/ArgO family amino acid transporter [Mangrovicella endophytica]|uniref:LysE/ArgO family amino acid transporter n=1 Tax=Mangrovicella endophytica TaxID=2066697 RepID=UPI000C9E0DB4|nr:LysE/ArgO family amino acid transporter [Mangrovicella endophytica]